MLEKQKMISASLCDHCQLKDICGTAKMPGIVLSCGKRAKHEALEKGQE